MDKCCAHLLVNRVPPLLTMCEALLGGYSQCHVSWRRQEEVAKGTFELF